MVKRLAALMFLVACGPAAEETVVNELRVMQVIPQEAGVSWIDGAAVTAAVFRTTDAPVDVLQWVCADGPLGCLEAGSEEAPVDLSLFTQVSSDPDPFSVHLVPPRPDLLEQEPTASFLWALACVEGVCPIIDEVRANPAPGSDAWNEVVAQLADWEGLLQTLPKVDTAGSFRVLPSLPVPRTGLTPLPTATLAFPETDDLTIPSGGTLDLRFEVSGGTDVVAWPFATASGFVTEFEAVVDGTVTVTLTAGAEDAMESPPLEPGTELQVLVSFESSDGGAATWTDIVRVTEP